jgi:nanoRNase/pAp phosphatase (c-di-AMP/oligoRNAs hydrolase)
MEAIRQRRMQELMAKQGGGGGGGAGAVRVCCTCALDKNCVFVLIAAC